MKTKQNKTYYVGELPADLLLEVAKALTSLYGANVGFEQKNGYLVAEFYGEAFEVDAATAALERELANYKRQENLD